MTETEVQRQCKELMVVAHMLRWFSECVDDLPAPVLAGGSSLGLSEVWSFLWRLMVGEI